MRYKLTKLRLEAEAAMFWSIGFTVRTFVVVLEAASLPLALVATNQYFADLVPILRSFAPETLSGQQELLDIGFYFLIVFCFWEFFWSIAIGIARHAWQIERQRARLLRISPDLIHYPSFWFIPVLRKITGVRSITA